ncbi:DUF389 domain-containing protein [Actinotalea sp. M2MS4P-6]|uniref:DUF389 domain-containing protein n=1 Tax=Actinotalea sp. M2MS4P-6 TaxID=2983762 RepID=UPI0021E42EAD|nr:DUF389 domain-containing protein [Actinotalea sp. M2MS4P-6]MCV2395236.1 DUF389 domain-containing protein [Actinotalea sp. M2MS4P-6]
MTSTAPGQDPGPDPGPAQDRGPGHWTVWRGRLGRWTNRATTTGATAVVLGLVALLIPSIGTTVARFGLGVVLGVAGARDLRTTFRRGSDRRVWSRLLLGLRGLGSLAMAAVLLIGADWVALSLIFLLGLYLLFRGMVQLVSAALLRTNRGPRFVAALMSLGLGALAVLSPRALAGGLVFIGGMLAVIIGALMLLYGARAARTDTPDFDRSLTTVVEIVLAWVRDADLGPERREEISEQLYMEPPGRAGKIVAFWVMLGLSVAIATLAVLQDSTAVVIGAMLVAPLMTPILGLAGALVNGWSGRGARSLLLVVAGALAAVVIAVALSSWLPSVIAFDSNSQITSRVSPNLLDLLIAVAAGAAGAYATVATRVSSSIAGVAIAVALVPPLSVVGICLTSGHPSAAAGAALLFVTNFVAIVLSAVLVFLLTGFVEPDALLDRGRRLRRTLLPFVALALIVTVPLLFTSEGLLVANDRQVAADAAVAEWLADTEVIATSVSVDGRQVEVHASGPGVLPDVADLRAALAPELGAQVEVRVVFTPAQVVEVGP